MWTLKPDGGALSGWVRNAVVLHAATSAGRSFWRGAKRAGGASALPALVRGRSEDGAARGAGEERCTWVAATTACAQRRNAVNPVAARARVCCVIVIVWREWGVSIPCCLSRGAACPIFTLDGRLSPRLPRLINTISCTQPIVNRLVGHAVLCTGHRPPIIPTRESVMFRDAALQVATGMQIVQHRLKK